MIMLHQAQHYSEAVVVVVVVVVVALREKNREELTHTHLLTPVKSAGKTETRRWRKTATRNGKM